MRTGRPRPTTLPTALCRQPVTTETGRDSRLGDCPWPGPPGGRTQNSLYPHGFQTGRSRAPATQPLTLEPEEAGPFGWVWAAGRRLNYIFQEPPGTLARGTEKVTSSCCQGDQSRGIWAPEARGQRSWRQRREIEERMRMENLFIKQHKEYTPSCLTLFPPTLRAGVSIAQPSGKCRWRCPKDYGKCSY